MPEVAEVAIDFDARTATVTSKPGMTVTREAIEAALRPGGYGVERFAVAPAPAAADP